MAFQQLFCTVAMLQVCDPPLPPPSPPPPLLPPPSPPPPPLLLLLLLLLLLFLLSGDSDGRRQRVNVVAIRHILEVAAVRMRTLSSSPLHTTQSIPNAISRLDIPPKNLSTPGEYWVSVQQ